MPSRFTDEHVDAHRGQTLAPSLRDSRNRGCGELWAWLLPSWERIYRLQSSLKILQQGTPGGGGVRCKPGSGGDQMRSSLEPLESPTYSHVGIRGPERGQQRLALALGSWVND